MAREKYSVSQITYFYEFRYHRTLLQAMLDAHQAYTFKELFPAPFAQERQADMHVDRHVRSVSVVVKERVYRIAEREQVFFDQSYRVYKAEKVFCHALLLASLPALYADRISSSLSPAMNRMDSITGSSLPGSGNSFS